MKRWSNIRIVIFLVISLFLAAIISAEQLEYKKDSITPFILRPVDIGSVYGKEAIAITEKDITASNIKEKWYVLLGWKEEYDKAIEQTGDYNAIEFEDGGAILTKKNFPVLIASKIKQIDIKTIKDGSDITIKATAIDNQDNSKDYESKGLASNGIYSVEFDFGLFDKIKIYTKINAESKNTQSKVLNEQEQGGFTWEAPLLTQQDWKKAVYDGTQAEIPQGQDSHFILNGNIALPGTFKIYSITNDVVGFAAISDPNLDCSSPNARCSATLSTSSLASGYYTIRYSWSSYGSNYLSTPINVKIGNPEAQTNQNIKIKIATRTSSEIPIVPKLEKDNKKIYLAALNGNNIVFLDKSRIRKLITEACGELQYYGDRKYGVMGYNSRELADLILKDETTSNTKCPLINGKNNILFAGESEQPTPIKKSCPDKNLFNSEKECFVICKDWNKSCFQVNEEGLKCYKCKNVEKITYENDTLDNCNARCNKEYDEYINICSSNAANNYDERYIPLDPIMCERNAEKRRLECYNECKNKFRAAGNAPKPETKPEDGYKESETVSSFISRLIELLTGKKGKKGPTCRDTDVGNDIFRAGYIEGTDENGGPYKIYDSCIDEYVINEQTCSWDKKPKTEERSCSLPVYVGFGTSKCKDGACGKIYVLPGRYRMPPG